MKSIIKFLFLILFAFSFSTCIDELDVDTEQGEPLLVVEGSINSQPGPHTVLLSSTAKYGSILDDAIEKESGANVWVRDNAGDVVFLTEETPGVYKTPPEFQAEVGKKYSLFVTLANGDRYVSSPEEVIPVPPIDSVIVGQDLAFSSGVEMYIRWQDPADEANFYLLEADGIFILNSRPDLHVARNFFGNPVPAPKDCCDKCYVYEENVDPEIRIFKDNLTNGSQITELAAFIPGDGRRFMERYMVAVKHSSITKEAFQFLNLVKEQLSIQGNIFDPPPASIGGNMINLDDPDKSVIGYFRASDTTTDTVYVNRSDLVDPVIINQLNDDCRVIDNSTTEKPPFWM